MSTNNWLTILYFFIILILLVMAFLTYISACYYERTTKEFTDKLHTMPKIKSFLKQTGELFTLGIYQGYSEEVKELNVIAIKSKTYKQYSIIGTSLFFLISIFLLGYIYFFISKKGLFIGSMLIISFISLIVGLFSPILMIVSYKDIPMLGRTVFMFQSKGIITTIETLFNSGNIVVAIPLLLFSVLIPFTKTILMGAGLFKSCPYIVSQSLYIIKVIGKWSMADVFVVSLLLTYFTVNKDKFTDAEVQVGLYFFLGYVIFSMVVSHFLTR